MQKISYKIVQWHLNQSLNASKEITAVFLLTFFLDWVHRSVQIHNIAQAHGGATETCKGSFFLLYHTYNTKKQGHGLKSWSRMFKNTADLMTKLTLLKDILKDSILCLITKMFFLLAPSKIHGCKEKLGIFPQEGCLSEVWRFYLV